MQCDFDHQPTCRSLSDFRLATYPYSVRNCRILPEKDPDIATVTVQRRAYLDSRNAYEHFLAASGSSLVSGRRVDERTAVTARHR